ncbi:PepSY-like domain-containing protein [Ohtaekwangia kribbensis]|uniref:PepSY-like domain-containing protein n=1 Tax=Ohtaekwangia kribbensis TaxID=688913 RepID=A0ABW3KF54_9BACT
MKKLIILLLAVWILNVHANAQDIPQSQVPSVILNAFQVKFPNATDVDWELKGDQYKVDFEIGTRDHDVWIDKSGNIKKHKEDISKKDLPQGIVNKIAKDFSSYKIDGTDKIEADGKVVYLVELDGTADDRKVTFTSTGDVQENIVD